MTQFKIIQGKFHVKGYQPDGDSLQEDVTSLPKLFRRLVEFFDAYGNFKDLPAYMARQKDNLQLWDDPTPRSLASLMDFEVTGRRMSLPTPIEDILFSPKG